MDNAVQKVVVIMAGGSGTRLWPLSRQNNPKQFQALVGESTLLEETYARVLTLVPKESIYIATGEQHQQQVKALLPDVPEDNILVEPEAKNTAPAISYCTAIIASRLPSALIATVASDHVIANESEFTKTFTTAFSALETYPDSLVTVGINPTRPDTGFGYIQMGDEKNTINGQKIFSIQNFKEKPDAKTANKYLADWAYLWNAGYFIFSAQSFLNWCETFTPEIVSGVERMLSATSTEEKHEIYKTLPTIAVEPAIIEKLPEEKRLVIPSALEWSDVGNWGTLLEELQKLSGKKVVPGPHHIDIKSDNLLVKQSGTKKFIGTIGLNNIVIIDTDDALLVADTGSVATDIKDLLEEIKKSDPELS